MGAGRGENEITVCCENGESYINSATPNLSIGVSIHGYPAIVGKVRR
jgi:hypothetical protein